MDKKSWHVDPLWSYSRKLESIDVVLKNSRVLMECNSKVEVLKNFKRCAFSQGNMYYKVCQQKAFYYFSSKNIPYFLAMIDKYYSIFKEKFVLKTNKFFLMDTTNLKMLIEQRKDILWCDRDNYHYNGNYIKIYKCMKSMCYVTKFVQFISIYFN